MSDNSLTAFISYLNNNPNVRSKVEQLERSLATAFQDEADSIAAIAAGAGFDITDWNARPSRKDPGAADTRGCCGFMTVGTEKVEKALEA